MNLKIVDSCLFVSGKQQKKSGDMKMNAVEFTKWMAEQDITGADEKVVYYMAMAWIHNAKEAVKKLEEESK